MPDARHQRSRHAAERGEPPRQRQNNATSRGKPGVPGTTLGAKKTTPSAPESLIGWESVADVPLAVLSSYTFVGSKAESLVKPVFRMLQRNVHRPGVLVFLAVAGLAGSASRVAAAEIPGWPFDAKAAARDQQAAAKQLGVPVERELVLGDGVKLQLILVPSGRFLMGSPKTEVGRETGKCAPENEHEVILTRPFYIGKTEVSQEQFQALMGVNPSEKQGPKLPVEKVTWEMSVEFCTKLGEVAKAVGRLPTEAEWEWACRAGSGGAHCLGDDPLLLDRVAWYEKNSKNRTHPVGEKEPNAWGIHDMHGNVMEWVHDAWVRPSPYPDGPLTDPKGASQGHKIRRGAFCGQPSDQVRSAHRHYGTSTHTGGAMGFRAVIEPPPSR